MAQDADLPKAADKGKGKAVDDPKNDSSVVNGKKAADEKAGMVSFATMRRLL
jgi:26S proteasome regulatory subunit N1